MITWAGRQESAKPSHEILQLPFIQDHLEQCRTKALKRYEDSELQQHLSEVLETVRTIILKEKILKEKHLYSR